VRQRLIDAGVQAEIHDELGLEKFWGASKSTAGVRLEVPANDFDRAFQLLLTWEKSENTLHEAIHCPECHSFRVEYPQVARRCLLPNLVIGALAAVGVVQNEFYCQDCHFTWPREGTRPSRLRSHMAPYYFIEGIEQTKTGTSRPH